MKKIKDPALFEKIREFLTEHLPIIKKESSNTVAAYRYTLNLYLDFLQEVSSRACLKNKSCTKGKRVV